jgi:hypothetical protein
LRTCQHQQFESILVDTSASSVAAEDKVEVLEKHVNNGGRDPFPKLVRKCKIPKRFLGINNLGVSPDDISDFEYIRDTDLLVGNYIDVFGRVLFLYDCDGFTRKYYQHVHGLSQRENCLEPDELIEFPKLEEPPYTGVGDENDSIAAFYKLAPTGPRGPGLRREELSDVVFRWKAKLDLQEMVHAGPDDSKRRFIVSFYLFDSTIAVYEPPVINSGFLGGKFLERQRVLRRGFQKTDSQYISAHDLTIPLPGTVWINGYPFMLLECDRFTQRYLNRGDAAADGPLAEDVLAKLRAALGPRGLAVLAAELRGLEPEREGAVSIDGFAQALRAAGAGLDEDDLLALVQHWDRLCDGTVRLEEFIAAATAP